MPHVKEEILSVDIVDIAIVVIVSPIWRPGIDQDKSVATILKFRTTLHDLRMMHREVMLPAKLSAEPVVGNPPAVSTHAIMILRPARFLAACFLPSLFLTARFRSALFLPVRFLLRWPHVAARLGLLRSLLLLGSLLLGFCCCSGSLLALLLGARRLGFVLPRRFHFILPRCRLALLLLRFGPGLVLLRWLLLPLGLFLLRFFVLLFVVLRVKDRRTRKQSREDS